MNARTLILCTALLSAPAASVRADDTAVTEDARPASVDPGASAEARLAAALERKVARSNELRTQAEPLVAAAAIDVEPDSAAWRWAGGAGGFALLLMLGAFWLKRTREARLLSSEGVGLTIQESIWVGKGQRLMVVNAAGQRYLLGATSAGLETLAELGPLNEPTTARSEASDDDVDAPAGPATFKDLVQQAMSNPANPRTKRKQIIDGLRAL